MRKQSAMKGRTYRFKTINVKTGRTLRGIKYMDLQRAHKGLILHVLNGYPTLELIDTERGDKTCLIVTRLGKTISWRSK